MTKESHESKPVTSNVWVKPNSWGHVKARRKQLTSAYAIQLYRHLIEVENFTEDQARQHIKDETNVDVKDFNAPDEHELRQLEKLEDSWQLISKEYNNASELIIRDGDSAENPLIAFMNSVKTGFYPPPELLLAMSDCFDMYLSKRGGRSLDEVFFARASNRSGNWARRHASESDCWFLHMMIEGNIRESSAGRCSLKTKKEVIQEYQELHNIAGEPESLQTKLTKWEKKNINQI